MSHLRSFALSMLCFASLAALAQESKVRWKASTNFQAPPDEGTCFAKVVKGDNGCFVGLRVKGNSIVLGGLNQVELDRTLEAYTFEGLNKIKFDKTKILWGEGPVTVETIERFGGAFRVIATKPDPENGKLLLIQQMQSPRSLTGKGGQLLAEIPYDRLGKSNDYFKPNIVVGFTTTVGTDSTKLLIGLSPESTIRKAGCPIYAQVFDKQMKLLWYNTLQTESSARSVEIIDTKVDPQGAVWYLIKNVTNPEPKAKEDLGYNLMLYRMDSVGQQGFVVDIPGKEFAQDIVMDAKADGSMIFGGVYGGEESNRNESVGAYTCIFDTKALKFDRFKLMPFDKRIEKKVEMLQINMKADRIMWKKNGGAFLVTKKSGEETHYVADLSGKKSPKTEQVDGDLHIFELDATGEKKWYKTYNRELDYENDVPGRIISCAFEDALFIVLNDAEANIEKRKLKSAVDLITSRRDAVLVEFKSDGNEKSKRVLEGPGPYQQVGIQADHVWRIAPGMYITTGVEGFGKDKSWPVYLSLSSEAKK